MKKLIQENKITCPDYKKEEKRGKCEYLGIFSGRCFKRTNPLMSCKEVKAGRINIKEEK